MIWLDLFVKFSVLTSDPVWAQSTTSNCSGDPCRNGAVCEDTDAGYQCYCVDGYAGSYCEINFDDCSSRPCLNNATCVDDVAAYRCLCQAGLTGDNCQINIDECISNPCLKNGTCIDLMHGYICECPLPYKGGDCSLLPCEKSPCENGAVCYDDVMFNFTTTGFYCECPFGFEGQYCEINIDDCNTTACSGQGICVDGVGDYSCLCEPGFDGDNCQFPINDCIGNECRNNATCHDLHLGYWCNCTVSGYEGLLCERERDECTSWEPCQNDATCVDEFNGYSCHCTENWTGRNCTHKVNRCLKNPCLNNAGCLDTLDGFSCLCQPFYTGRLCEIEFNPCATEYNPCQNEAACITPPDGQYICFCQNGFTGQNCEVDVNECLSTPCFNNATCEDMMAGYICHCLDGWSGHECEINIDDCASEPCFNGSTCVDFVSRFECVCAEHFTGLLCEELVDYCLSKPCYHDASCSLIVGGYLCHCLPPNTGPQCLDLIDACESEPCHHNGSCVSLSPGYYCNCVSPYTGRNCDDIVSYCASEPCLNDGLCREGFDDFICICPPLLTGKQCTDLIDYCDENPCKNDGICLNAHFTYRCVCAYGFKGVNCTEMVDLCSVSPCLNLGNCSNIPGGYTCECGKSFTGRFCETILPLLPTSSYSAVMTSLVSVDKTLSSTIPFLSGRLTTLITTEISPSSLSRVSIGFSLFITKSLIRTTTSINLQESGSSINFPVFSSIMETSVRQSIKLTEISSISIVRSPSEKVSPQVSDISVTASLIKTTASSPFAHLETSFIITSLGTHSLTFGILSQTITKPVSGSDTATIQSAVPIFSSAELKPVITTRRTNVFASVVVLNSSSRSYDNMFSMSSPPYLAITTQHLSSSLFDSVLDFSLSSFSSFIESSSISESMVIFTSSPVISDTTWSNIASSVSHDSVYYKTTLTTNKTVTSTVNISLAVTSTSTDFRIMSTSVIPETKTEILIVSQYESTEQLLSPVLPITTSSYVDSSVLLSTILYSSMAVKSKPISYISSLIEESMYLTLNSVSSSAEMQIPSSSGLSYYHSPKSDASASQEITGYLSQDIYTSITKASEIMIQTFLPSKSETYSISLISPLHSTWQESVFKSGNVLDQSKTVVHSSLNKMKNMSVSPSVQTSEISSDYMSSSEHNRSSDYKSDLYSERQTFPQTYHASSKIHESSDFVPSNSLLSSIVGISYTSEKIKPTPTYKIISSSVGETRLLSEYSEQHNSTLKISSASNVLLLSELSLSVQTSPVLIIPTSSYMSLLSSETSTKSTAVAAVSTFEYLSSLSIASDLQSSQRDITSERALASTSVFIPTSIFESESIYFIASSSKIKETSTVSDASLEATSMLMSASSSLISLRFKSSVSSHTDSDVPSSSWLSFSGLTTKSLHEPDSVEKSSPSFMLLLSSLHFTSSLLSVLDTEFVTEVTVVSSSKLHGSLSNRFAITKYLTSASISSLTHSKDISSSSLIFSPTSKSSELMSLNTSAMFSTKAAGEVSSRVSSTKIAGDLSSRIFSTKGAGGFSSGVSSTNIAGELSVEISSTKIAGEFSSGISSLHPTLTSSIIMPTEHPDRQCDIVTCYNGGVCREAGYLTVCDCLPRFTGRFCETAVTMPLSLFDGRTVLDMGDQNITDSLAIQMSFQTSQNFGTVLYYQLNTEYTSSTVSLLIVDGTLQFQFMCESQSFLLDTRYTVSDAQIYFAVVRQTQLCQASLDLHQDSSIQPPLTWIIGTNQIVEIEHMTKLSKLLIGGSSIELASEYDRNFTGCLGNVWVSGLPLWVNDSLNKLDLMKCETSVSPELCDDVDCLNGGQCHISMITVGAPTPVCDCMIPYTGVRCETEMLLYYPSFDGTSFLKYAPPPFYSSQSNEIYLTVRPHEADGTLLVSANQNSRNKKKSFIHLYLEEGIIKYRFSCDGETEGAVDTVRKLALGESVEIIIRQSWTSGPGQWCSAAVVVNTVVYVSQQFLSVGPPQSLGNLFIGGIPRNSTLTVVRQHGFVGCVRELQVNDLEHDLISMAAEGINIGNCDVPVCEHNPCENGATCHSTGKDWFCECVTGYIGRLCTDRLCTSNLCLHGGTCVVVETQDDQLCLCPLGRGGIICEEAVTISMPHFSGTQYGHASFLAYENMFEMRDEFEMRFSFVLENNTNTASSLMLLMGNSASRFGDDYMVLGLYKDHILFRYNLGSGEASVWSPGPLDATIPHHTVQFGRQGREGWLKVDTQNNVTGRSLGVLTALNTDNVLYVGGADNEVTQFMSSWAKLENGFRGCIYNLEISMSGGDFITPGSPPGLADYGRSVGQCSSLSCSDDSPCQNQAQCVELGASIYCNCTAGWKGLFCTEMVTVCDTGHSCVEGATCLPRLTGGYECLCPLGRTGENCSQDITISDPSFVGEKSFMTLTPVYIKHKTDIRLQIKTRVLDSLLFYVARQLHSYSGDFLSLVLHAGRLQLRYHHGDKLNIIKSDVIINPEMWYEVEAGRNSTHGYVTVNGHMTVAMATGMMSYLDTATDFYLGGMPDLDLINPSAVPSEPSSFQGCVRELIVNTKVYLLTEKGALAGRSIVDCDGTHCGYSVCANGGNCTVTTSSPGYTCTCSDSYYDDRCEQPIECRDLNCHNGGICRQLTGGHFGCSCLIGWYGPSCDTAISIGTSVRLTKDSFIYFVDPDYETSNKTYTHITLTLRTTNLNGFLLWNGQRYSDDEDYLGVGLKDGRIRLVFNLGWYSRSEILTSRRYNDGQWHTILIERHAESLSLTVNGFEWISKVPGDFTNLDTYGHYFIGGFLESSVYTQTLEFFTNTFEGCVKDIQIHNSDPINFLQTTGENILNC